MIDRLFFIIPWAGDKTFWSLRIEFACVLRLDAYCYLAPHLHEFSWSVWKGFGHRTDWWVKITILRRLYYRPYFEEWTWGD